MGPYDVTSTTSGKQREWIGMRKWLDQLPRFEDLLRCSSTAALSTFVQAGRCLEPERDKLGLTIVPSDAVPVPAFAFVCVC